MSAGGERIDWSSHRRAAEDEDIAWLTDTVGLSLEAACARVGVDPETYQKRCRTKENA